MTQCEEHFWDDDHTSVIDSANKGLLLFITSRINFNKGANILDTFEELVTLGLPPGQEYR